MHLLATNLCVWFVTAVTETAEDYRQQDYISHSQFTAICPLPVQCLLTTVSSLPLVLFLLSACPPQSVHCHFSSCSVLAHHSQFMATSPLPAQCFLTSHFMATSLPAQYLLTSQFMATSPLPAQCLLTTISSLPRVLFLFNACSPQSVHCHFSSSCSVLAHHSQFTATSLPAQCLLTTVSSWPLLFFLLNAFSPVSPWPLLFFLLNACSPQSVFCQFSSSCSMLVHHSQFMATSLPAQCFFLTTVSSWPLLFLLNACSPVSSLPLLFLLSACSPVSSRPLLFLLNACSPQSVHGHFSSCSVLAHHSQFMATYLPAQCLLTTVIRVAESQLCGLNCYK